jgi:hypothetical protein
LGLPQPVHPAAAGLGNGVCSAAEAEDAPTAAKPEVRPATPATAAEAQDNADRQTRHLRENALLWRLGLVNALNGLGIGMVAPLMAYWYLVRYGHGPASIGPAMAVSFVFAAFGAQIASRLAQRFGAVRAVVGMRTMGLIMLVLTPLSPVFWIAAGFYALRATANQGTMGRASGTDREPDGRGSTRSCRNRQQCVHPDSARHRAFDCRGFAAPGLADRPVFCGSYVSGAYLVLYQRFFKNIEPRDAAP